MNWQWLYNTFWGNQVVDYLYFLGLIGLAYLLRFFAASLIAAIILRVSRLFSYKLLTVRSLLIHLRKPFEALVLLGTVYVAFLQLKMPPDFSSETAHKIVELGRVAFKFVLISLLLWLLTRTIRLIAHHYRELELQSGNADLPDLQLVQLTATVAKVVVSLVAMLLYLSWGLGLDAGSILAGFGIGGIAIALAAKETIENLLGSITIFLDKPFKVGDYIKVGDFEGVIEYVGIRSVRVRTMDGTLLSVPNKKIVDSNVENFQLRTHRFVLQNIGIKHETPVENIQAAVAEIKKFLDSYPAVSPDSAVHFFDFEESSLKIRIIYTVVEGNGSLFPYLRVREHINTVIMQVLSKHNISLAYPTRMLYSQTISSTNL